MRAPILVLAGALAMPLLVSAQGSEAIDFPGFLEDSTQAFEHRQSRLVDIETFNDLAAEGALILDTRSRAAYELRHLEGAVHLNFSDITKESLERIVGSTSRRVLIYCNNNFLNDPVAFASKQPAAALNIPTFIALYTYGYRELFELGELLDVADSRLTFAGSSVS